MSVEHDFIAEARHQGLNLRQRLADGSLVIGLGEREVTVSLENLARDLARGLGSSHLTAFVEAVRQSLLSPPDDLPGWEEARTRVRFSLEPDDTEFGDTLRSPFAGRAVRILVYVTPDEMRISFLTPRHLERWNVDRAEAERTAAANMDALLSTTEVETRDIDAHRLGNFDSGSIFKAALLTAPSLRAKLEPQLGWPILAVIPCRDFVFVFHDDALLERLGTVVVREYQQSGYPITTEVLEFSNDGVRAIGDYDSRTHVADH